MIFSQHERFEERKRQVSGPQDDAWAYLPPSAVVTEARGGPKIVGDWVDYEYRSNRSAHDRGAETPLYPHEDFTKPNSKMGGRIGRAVRPCAESDGVRKKEWRKGKDNSTPGPGAYRPQHRILKPEKTPQILPRREHGGIFEKNKKGGPGPGQYNVLGKLIKKSYNKKAGGGFKPSLPKKSKPSLTNMAPFRMRSQEERRKINTPFMGSPRGQQQQSASSTPRSPGSPPTSKAFSRNSRTSSPFRGRRARSRSPGMPSFGIGARTAIKRGWSADGNRGTRMAASRSVPSSPRPDSAGYNSPTGKAAPKSLGSPRTPTVLQWTSQSGKTARHAVGGDSPPDGVHFAGQWGHGHGHGHRPSSNVSSPGSPSRRGFKSPRGASTGDNGAVYIGGDTFLTEGRSDALHLLHKPHSLSPASSSPQSRPRQWPQYEYSESEGESEGEEADTQGFPGLQEDSEDSRHFYVPPLAHQGLRERPASGGSSQPVHSRTTAAVEQSLKGPAQFMHEIRGALEDLKALSKLQINSPRTGTGGGAAGVSPVRRGGGGGGGGGGVEGPKRARARARTRTRTRSRDRSGDKAVADGSNLDKGANEMDLPIFV